MIYLIGFVNDDKVAFVDYDRDDLPDPDAVRVNGLGIRIADLD
jgi:hypothetical protein